MNDDMLPCMGIYLRIHALMSILQYLPSNLYYKMHQISKFKCFSCVLAAVFSQSIESMWQVENEDVVGAAPTGDAPTTSEWYSLIAHKGATYIRNFTVIFVCKRNTGCDTLNTILNCLQRYRICNYNTGCQIMKWWVLWNITMILRHMSSEGIPTICHVPNDLNVNGKY